MQSISRAFSGVLCCFGRHEYGDLQPPAKLQKIHVKTPSPISSSIQDASNLPMLDSPDTALDRIFATDSSVRGYSAAKSRSNKRHQARDSLDLHFRFGSESPEKKPHDRLEQLTSHVKQQLSDGGVNQSSGRCQQAPPRPLQAVSGRPSPRSALTSELLGHSQRSTALTDLLASRTASEGGYDSDAKSIGSPLLPGSVTTIELEPKLVQQPIPSVGPYQVEEHSDGVRVELEDNVAKSPLDSVATVHHADQPANILQPTLTPPGKISLLKACQADPTASPDEILRRVSIGIAEGSIQMPPTPRLQPMQSPNSNGLDEQWRLSSGPPDTDLTSRHLHEFEHDVKSSLPNATPTMKMLADHIKSAREESKRSVSGDSLTSHFDPALLDCIEKFARADTTVKLDREPTPPTTVIKVREQPNTVGNTLAASTASSEIKSSDPAVAVSTSNISSDVQSLHLFDMGIPRRLASTSRPVLSSADNSEPYLSQIKAAPSKTLDVRKRRTFSAERVPTFIAIEHNRRPSDPQTKALFEPSLAPQRIGSHWRRSLSNSNPAIEKTSESGLRPFVDDSSSYYGSLNEDQQNSQNGSRPSTRRSSLRNFNSLAVAGRTASGALFRGSIDGITEQNMVSPWRDLSRAYRSDPPDLLCDREQAFQDSVTAKRSLIFPAKQNQLPSVEATPTPLSRRLLDSTETNENMSEIGVAQVYNGNKECRRTENSDSIQDRRNENFSDIFQSLSKSSAFLEADKANLFAEWLGRGYGSNSDFDHTHKAPEKSLRRDLVSLHSRKPYRHDAVESNASDLWHKAFDRIDESADYGRLLATSRFDREGRRKISVKSTSEQAPTTREMSLSSLDLRKSRSLDLERHFPCGSPGWQKPRRKSVSVLPGFGAKSMKGRTQAWVHKGKVRKNLFDLSWQADPTEHLKSNVKPASLRSVLGMWARFPSHNRDERNGPAGEADDVYVRDFVGMQHHHSPYQSISTPATRSAPSIGLRPRRSWKLLAFTRPALNRQNTRSMIFGVSSSDRAKQRRKGFAGKLRRLYRTRSSSFHTYMTTGDHRSRISTSSSLEYPELEIPPSEGAFALNLSQRRLSSPTIDGTSEHRRVTSLGTVSEVTSKRSRSSNTHTLPKTKRDANEWAKMYRDCVGSLSELNSDASSGDHDSTPSEGHRPERQDPDRSSELRDSTLDFRFELQKDVDKVKADLLPQVHSNGSGESEGLRMPGSFV